MTGAPNDTIVLSDAPRACDPRVGGLDSGFWRRVCVIRQRPRSCDRVRRGRWSGVPHRRLELPGRHTDHGTIRALRVGRGARSGGRRTGRRAVDESPVGRDVHDRLRDDPSGTRGSDSRRAPCCALSGCAELGWMAGIRALRPGSIVMGVQPRRGSSDLGRRWTRCPTHIRALVVRGGRPAAPRPWGAPVAGRASLVARIAGPGARGKG